VTYCVTTATAVDVPGRTLADSNASSGIGWWAVDQFDSSFSKSGGLGPRPGVICDA